MGIKSTQYISREKALKRISEQVNYLKKHQWYNLQQSSSEDVPLDGLMVLYLEDEILEVLGLYNLSDFYTNDFLEDSGHLTDKMLEDTIDLPFIRYSMFDNYIINESEELK